MSTPRILKYPRTPHLEGSRLQPGDEDLSQISFTAICGKHIVVEEKIDGANCAVSFDEDGVLLLQSRGHYLIGGYKERHFDLFKIWANVHRNALYAVLGARYVMYGEWMYAKHAIFYDKLPHYFVEFDVYDREKKLFLDTHARAALLESLPVVSAPILAEGEFDSLPKLLSLVGNSRYISPQHIEKLRNTCVELGVDPDRACSETDSSLTMEGIYIKVEEGGAVKERLKYVRASYSQHMADSSTPWINRTIIPNSLDKPLEALFLPTLK